MKNKVDLPHDGSQEVWLREGHCVHARHDSLAQRDVARVTCVADDDLLIGGHGIYVPHGFL